MSIFLGIDVGTSSVKSMLMRSDGTIIDLAQSLYNIVEPMPDYAEIPVDALWNSTKETIKMVLNNNTSVADEIRGIGFSGQMHSLILLGRDDRPLRNAIVWLDQRSKKEAEELDALSNAKGFNKRLLNKVSPIFFLCFMYWVLRNEPEIYSMARVALLVKDYIRYKICGGFATDYSDAAGSMVFDMVNREWAWDLIEELGFNKALFPEVHCAHEIAGYVTKQCAIETGLREGIPVCYGGGDTLMNHIGNGLISYDGRVLSTIGTSSHVSGGLAEPLHDPKQRAATYCHALAEKWLMLCGGRNGGVVMKWLKRNILGETLSFDEMSKIGSTVPAGSDGVMFLPYLVGSENPYDPHAKAVYLGFGLNHSQGHLIRSTMEGLMFVLKKSLKVLESVGFETTSIIATGGGSKDKLLVQMQADMYNKDIYINIGREISCMGAAIAAAVGTGYFASYDEACAEIVKFSPHVINPIPRNVEIYDEIFNKYDELYENNKCFFK